MENNEENNRQLKLYRLARLIKSLYPATSVSTSYKSYQSIIDRLLDEDEKLLFEDLLSAITVLNGFGRKLGGRTLYSSESDFMNALQLVLPKDLQLTERVLDVHQSLLKIFGDKGFTYLEARNKLRISETHLRRLLKPMFLHKLAIREIPKSGRTKVYLKSMVHKEKESYQETFEQMQGEWKDFVGFVEF